VGRTTAQTIEPTEYAPVSEVTSEIERKLANSRADAVTLAGSGEPTLHSGIDRVIASIKGMTDTPVVLLTNGSLFWMETVRQRARMADVIMPTLSTVFEHTFRKIHRPHPNLELRMIIDGLSKLREIYEGQLHLEVVLLAGINDTGRELEGLKAIIDRISPDKIQLNTVVRPPSDSRAISLDRKRLEEIKVLFGESAEIIAEVPVLGDQRKRDSVLKDLLEMVRRRPLTSVDIANSVNLSIEEVEDLVKGLLIKGYIRQQEHSGDIYYLSNQERND
jgi:wyosine [tRNA(Phe)-imidazoG37] synthetase (radical SAM superfamily)